MGAIQISHTYPKTLRDSIVDGWAQDMEIMEQGASLCRAFFFSEGESLPKCFPVLALTSHCNLHLTVVELPFLISEQNTVGVSVK